jgi:DNA helicase-2/ATP-dependent DNA helicase PcrA
MISASSVHLRSEQAAIVDEYVGGLLGIAAVPGSGKTFALAQLAVRLVADRHLSSDQEVLIVTFTNSAVNGFQARIARALVEQHGLVPNVGYRVRTLHGLAHDIVRERPALVGLADDFAILDEKSALDIQKRIVVERFGEWWDRLSGYLDPEINPKSGRRQFEQYLPDMVIAFIKRAKDLQQTPADLEQLLRDADERFALAQFATNVYEDYQRSLAYRGAVDFDDLVRLALLALEIDPQYLARLRQRWPYILEDEAQDSTQLQEKMLRELSNNRNWVRVGDPNQAINTTFTTADPRFLLDFLDPQLNPAVQERPLSVSGRSAIPIIELANELVRWTVEEHPNRDLRDAFELRATAGGEFQRGFIHPTPPGDPQPNPAIEECLIHVEYDAEQKITPERELEIVLSSEEFSLAEWMSELARVPEDQRPTVAVLVPENSRGFKLVEQLRKFGLPYEELLRSTTETRDAVDRIRLLFEYMCEPADLKRLKQLFWGLLPGGLQDTVLADPDLRQAMTRLFAAFKNVEEFLWPVLPGVAGRLRELAGDYGWLADQVLDFGVKAQRWLRALELPVDQLVLSIAQDLFSEAVDLALAHKVAVFLGSVSGTHPRWRLPEFVDELRAISGNQRRFIGFDDAQAGYSPKPGVITVATMHAAKGLEWDRVYLLAVSNYGFPSALPYDSFVGERWFVRYGYEFGGGRLNLEAEMLGQLGSLVSGDLEGYVEGDATARARVEYSKERLRLLYMALTRARRELLITWNTGRFWRRGAGFENQPALPLFRLVEYVVRG